MYLFAIISSLICIQLLSTASSDTSAVNPSFLSPVLTQLPTILDSQETFNNDDENDEGYVPYPRSTSFLRFGRQKPSGSASFLRFGRQKPSGSASFLRFGRSHPYIVRFDRGGQNGATFLRFGRQTQQLASNRYRLGNHGEFLRFG